MDKSEKSSPEPSVKPTESGTTPPPQGGQVSPAPPRPAPPTAVVRTEAPEEPPEVPLTPFGWLMQNGIYLLLFLALVIWLYRNWGWDGLTSALLAAVGLGFVIFIHELGHFLVAKWCDVHVITFSIGFGPALPGCSFKRGETTYKIALFPLGGYVNMVGEGSEPDDDAEYPRSFKNKTVGQRMAIISAGVIMNVILGCLCFILVFRLHGRERSPAVIAQVDAGSPAWTAGVRSGWTIEQMGDRQRPFFEDLLSRVSLSASGQKIPFTFTGPEAPSQPFELEPRRDENNLSPVIGVSNLRRLEFLSERSSKFRPVPYLITSAMGAARLVELKPGDVPLESSVSRPEQVVPFDARLSPAQRWQEFSRRLNGLVGQNMTLKVRRQSGEEATLNLPPRGPNFGDRIIGTTRPDQTGEYDPLAVSELPLIDLPPPGGQARDYFVYRQRMRALAGKPVVLRLERGSATLDLFVPPAYHLDLGAIMEMGEVAAVRQGSPAQKAGVKPRETTLGSGDRVIGVVLWAEGKNEPLAGFGNLDRTNGLPAGFKPQPLDPVRLPWQLAQAARQERERKKRVVLIVPRPGANKVVVPTPLELDWDDSFDDTQEASFSRAAPMSIPQLGLAYFIESRIARVEQGKAAHRAGLQVGDIITEIQIAQAEANPGEASWGFWHKLEASRGKEKAYDAWAHVAYTFAGMDYPWIKVKVKRGDKVLEEPVSLTLEEDASWPASERGELLIPEQRLHKAEGLLAALVEGADYTIGLIQKMYTGIVRLIAGRISTKTMGGPITIVSATFGLALNDFWGFLLFLGIISINLAVVNFLPIPLLDGGHMVFLIYEKLRGKPASETIRNAAAWIGLALLAALMLYVFYLDIRRKTVGL